MENAEAINTNETAQAQVPAPDTQGQHEGEKSEAAEGTAAAPVEGEKPAAPEARPGAPKWAQARINKLTAEKHGYASANQQLAEENKSLRALLEKGGTPAPTEEQKRTMTAAQIEQLANQRAAEMTQVQRFNEQCNAVYEQGTKEFPDFKDVLQVYADLGGLNPVFVQAAIETGAAHAVLYHLAKDPDRASEILSLQPLKMAVEVAKLAGKLTTKVPAPVSNAPEPIKPVKGAAVADKNPEEMTTQEWMEWREKDLSKRRRA